MFTYIFFGILILAVVGMFVAFSWLEWFGPMYRRARDR